MPDFIIGDDVKARTRDGRRIQGVIVGMDFGKDDDILQCIVMNRKTRQSREVEPSTLRYQTDANGFFFKTDPRAATVTVGRNDRKLLDEEWFAKIGRLKLFASMKVYRRKK